jgi:hypothetical protein
VYVAPFLTENVIAAYALVETVSSLILVCQEGCKKHVEYKVALGWFQGPDDIKYMQLLL